MRLAPALVAAASALAACAAPPSPAARAARADTLAILRAVGPRPPDSVVSLHIRGDTAQVITSQPSAFVLVRQRGDWIPRLAMPYYEHPPTLGLQPQAPVPVDTTPIFRAGGEIRTMPVYPGDTRAQ